ncbi:hypothetical protein RJ639_040087 [Escallonia herrerae]|uniref:F-box domain-containing protein n=1 Tax=Escallonia herrerae TaxID=1293975 RepID=A0AA88WNL7_9ASTE|nr:hypothetical protein RJ639_040087 [Escallonia herrerae]
MLQYERRRNLRLLNLPSCILLEILTRLPIETISQCRYVCKTLRAVISDPHFCEIVFSRPNILIMDDIFHFDRPDSFYFVELGDNGVVLTEPKAINTNFDPKIRRLDLVGSCNGLVCFSSPNSPGFLYLTDPVLGRECAAVKVPNFDGDVYLRSYGFGFSPATWQYKVILTRPGKIMGMSELHVLAAVDAWKHSDFLCKNYILNGLDNALYNVYSPMVNVKALWESLERKYKTEDAGSKKFVVGKFLDFKMVDSKTVISQVQEFKLILHNIHAEGMVLGESFQVAALIEKLPPTWKDFKNYLKHKRKEIKLEDLIVRLRIEEDNRQSEKKAGKKPRQMWSSKSCLPTEGILVFYDPERRNFSRVGLPNIITFSKAYAFTGSFLPMGSAVTGEHWKIKNL